MQRLLLNGLVRRLAPESPDGELLERYLRTRDDDAFAQLVVRYSRLVWGQCRALLPNDADAEDAFQATFLTLARSAKTVRPGAPLGPWLHGVAYRVCLNARRANGRRAKREKRTAVPVETRPVADTAWDAAFAAVAEEVQKLPETQRAAFVLCCVEARPAADAAAALKVSPGTLATRLSRAKQTLLDRLAARGLGVSAVALGGVAVSAAPASAVNSTLLLVPAGSVIPRSVQLLTQGVTGMAALRFKLLAAGVVVAAGLGLTGGGLSVAQDAKPKPTTEYWQQLLHGERDAQQQAARAALAAAKADEAARADDIVRAGRRQVFEYEPVPESGFTEKQFEAAVAKREAAGWEFLSQVTLQYNRRVLAFRKVPVATAGAAVNIRPATETAKDKVPGRPAPVADPARAADAARAAEALLRDAADRERVLAWEAEAALRQAELARKKTADEQAAKIAELEKQLADLKTANSGPANVDLVKTFTTKDYGTWKADDLMGVVEKLLRKDAQAKKTGPFKLTLAGGGGFAIYGTQEAIDAAAELVRLLKK